VDFNSKPPIHLQWHEDLSNTSSHSLNVFSASCWSPVHWLSEPNSLVFLHDQRSAISVKICLTSASKIGLCLCFMASTDTRARGKVQRRWHVWTGVLCLFLLSVGIGLNLTGT
jgi:hypothetical protein